MDLPDDRDQCNKAIFVAVFRRVRVKYEYLRGVYAPNHRIISVFLFSTRYRYVRRRPFRPRFIFLPRKNVTSLYRARLRFLERSPYVIISRPANAFRSTDFATILNLQNKTHFCHSAGR